MIMDGRQLLLEIADVLVAILRLKWLEVHASRTSKHLHLILLEEVYQLARVMLSVLDISLTSLATACRLHIATTAHHKLIAAAVDDAADPSVPLHTRLHVPLLSLIS